MTQNNETEVEVENAVAGETQATEEASAPPVPVIPVEIEVQNWVLVSNGVVVEKRPYQQDENYIQAPAEVVPGFLYQDGNFSAPLPDYESLWLEVRRKRNALLAACDWTMLPDAPLDQSEKDDWGVYRQRLRDITYDFELPTDVVFPETPEA